MRDLEAIKKKVEGMRDRLGKPVDEKIKELVIGLLFCEIKTEGSCEGHLDHGELYPWVDIPYEYAQKLSKLVAWQNRLKLPDGRENKNTWVIRPGVALKLIPEKRDLPLEELQRRAEEFGLFLQNLPDNWFPVDWFK